jgi:hypothetical protein
VTGFAIWLLAYFALSPDWPTALLWLGALVHVPLALGLVLTDRERADKADALLNFVAWAQLPGALLLVASFTNELSGILLALPWIFLTGLCAVAGVMRIFKLGVRRPGALADWGWIWFAVSGAWTCASAMRWEAFGFPPIFVLLTGVHQMYAGLVLQVVAARIVAARPGRIPWLAALGVSLGNPAVAFGIMATHLGAPAWLEFGCVIFYAGSVIVLGWMQIFLALWPRSGLPGATRALLVLSDLSLGTAMTLAIIFGWGVARGYPTMTIPEMLQWHAPLNAFGFGLCALAGWMLSDSGLGIQNAAHTKETAPKPGAES